jgi:sialate O-acetylesterase
MVLQRNMKVPVWGRANPSEKVTVSFAGQKKETVCDKNGRWRIDLEPLKANSNATQMVISSGSDKKVIKNILVGEVWLGSGQSNMDYKLNWLKSPRNPKKPYPAGDYIKKELSSASDPLFRHITVNHQVSAYKPAEDFNGKWIDSKPGNNEDFSGTGYFFGRELRRKLKVPVGFIKCAWGATGIQPWTPASGYQQDKELAYFFKRNYHDILKKVPEWDQAKVDAAFDEAMKKWLANGKKGRKPFKRPRWDKSAQLPSTLFKGMVSAVIPYAVKGVIWYQGESNRGMKSAFYGKLFEALIKAWRQEWGQGEFPFIYAQLAAYYKPGDKSRNAIGWIGICEAQRRALKLPNTGMAVQIDIGDASNIHPKNKIDLAKRLSLWAYSLAYGIKLPAVSGPLYKSSEIKGNKVIITFDHAGSGLMTGHKKNMDTTVRTNEKLKFFELCDKAGKWHQAEAKITGKATIEVSATEVKEPVAARYGWASNPIGANLYNKEGLPSSLFTTE